jgi:hypothetical protein
MRRCTLSRMLSRRVTLPALCLPTRCGRSLAAEPPCHGGIVRSQCCVCALLLRRVRTSRVNEQEYYFSITIFLQQGLPPRFWVEHSLFLSTLRTRSSSSHPSLLEAEANRRKDGGEAQIRENHTRWRVHHRGRGGKPHRLR